MSEDPQALARIRDVLQELRKRYDAEAFKRYDPCEKQREFLRSPAYITCLIAANQVGKSHTASYAIFCHLTGLYPDWWDGPRFSRPIKAWCVGVTNESTRENCQNKLFGINLENIGGGWMPTELIDSFSKRRNVEDALDTVWIKHISGGKSVCSFKANEQGAAKMQGPSIDVIWEDEEIDKDVHDELLARTIAIPDAKMYMTFTPLKGATPLVCDLLDKDDKSLVEIIKMGWKDAPHLTPEKRAKLHELFKGQPHLLRAREEGDVSIGEDLVYPFRHDDIFCRPFTPEKWWPRMGAIDFGYTDPTAIGAFALDPDSGTYYLYNLYYKAGMLPPAHCSAIRPWKLPHLVYDLQGGHRTDPASGEQLVASYLDEIDPGWKDRPPEMRKMSPAPRGVMAGISTVYSLFNDGRLIIMDKPEMEPLVKELMLYRYDPKTQKPKDSNNHALDMIRFGMACQDKFSRISLIEPPSISFRQWKRARPGY